MHGNQIVVKHRNLDNIIVNENLLQIGGVKNLFPNKGVQD